MSSRLDAAMGWFEAQARPEYTDLDMTATSRQPKGREKENREGVRE
jgi:hypothetical protein